MQHLIESERPDVLGTDSHWHAVYTRHQHEKSVGDMLEKKGFEAFVPLYQARRRWHDRVKTLALPLFPSYVFLRGGIERQLQIVTTPGVHWMITAAGQVAVIPDAEIEAVKKLVESSLRVEPHPFLKCGDWVRVKTGPLEGMEGILVRIKSLCRLVLSVEMLQQSVAVEVDASNVERARRLETLPRRVSEWKGTGEPLKVPGFAASSLQGAS